jgi:hypothetical protein
MAFTPSSRVYLLDTPLDNKYKNQIHFTNSANQYSYFFAQRKHYFEGVTYQRKNNIIRVDEHIDNLWNVNYVMYQNTNFNSKWFYAFITKMEYVSDRATDIHIETDVYQTWLFACSIKKSFVVREHVNDDTIGLHLVDEQLETGEYKMSSYEPSDKLGSNWNILAVSDNTPLGQTDLIGNLYGQVVTGLTYYPFPNTSQGIEWLKETIQTYTTAGKIDAIVMIFTVPELIITSTVASGFILGDPIASGDPYGFDLFDELKQISNVDGYIPRNNKLFTHPYKFFYVSNNDGLSATYRYEDFPTNNMSFVVFGSVMPNPRVMLAPNDYRGNGLKLEYGLVLSGFPLCSWTADTYTAWLAQNSGATALTIAGSVTAIGAGIVTGNVLAIGGGVLAVANQLTQLYQASIQPDQAKGQAGSGSLMFGSNNLDFYFAHMTIKSDFARRIDNFFTMYGYKVNTLKIPEIHSRSNWNYIQTIDINIDGALPADDMQRLKKIYDDGVTLWHTPANFLDYSKTNAII